MSFLSELFGFGAKEREEVKEKEPALAAKEILEAESFWPHASFHNGEKRYKFIMVEEKIASVAVDMGLEHDDEFMGMLSEAIKQANMEVSIKNMKMNRVLTHCRKEAKKYGD